MPKQQDPRIRKAAECRLRGDHAQFKRLHGQLLAQFKPTRLARLIDTEELRLQRTPA